jgi:uncharacterized membrane protein (UPF0127 family)
MAATKRLSALNSDTGQTLASHVRVADTHATRAIGLMGRRALAPGEALWIVPSRGVHTCFMRFAIDIVALDDHGVVVDVVPAMKPWRMRLPRKSAVGVLELEAGCLEQTRTRVGHRIVFEPQETRS